MTIIFDESREFLKKMGLPDGDAFDLPTSTKTFPDGANFEMEFPGFQGLVGLKAGLKACEEFGIVENRLDETLGIMRHTKEEIKEYVRIAKDIGAELIMSVGPRASYDIGATVHTPQGFRIGYRLRGMEQVLRAIEDIKRAVDLGVRGILMYDEGLLYIINEMKKEGKMPKNLHLKWSGHNGLANPASAKIIESLGANSINPVRDLTLPMAAAIRQAVDVVIDLHTDNPAGSGGFIRSYEAPEMVRIMSPMSVKCGNSALHGHGGPVSADEAVNMMRQQCIVLELIKKYYPEAKQVPQGAKYLAIPE